MTCTVHKELFVLIMDTINIHRGDIGCCEEKTLLIVSTNTYSCIIEDQTIEMSTQDVYIMDWSSTSPASYSGAAHEPTTTRELTSEVEQLKHFVVM